jgi:hypothetical protein
MDKHEDIFNLHTLMNLGELHLCSSKSNLWGAS